ncbi:MAG: hypothetical protein NTV94_18760, partial [Planctomycetota bacterium]|nr:hypothetical protein [Planctomycetota bacterium]
VPPIPVSESVSPFGSLAVMRESSCVLRSGDVAHEEGVRDVCIITRVDIPYVHPSRGAGIWRL